MLVIMSSMLYNQIKNKTADGIASTRVCCHPKSHTNPLRTSCRALHRYRHPPADFVFINRVDRLNDAVSLRFALIQLGKGG
jgi:hypothetical protein